VALKCPPLGEAGVILAALLLSAFAAWLGHLRKVIAVAIY